MVAHQVAHVRDLGYSPVVAALTMSIVSGVGIVGAGWGCGTAALRLNIKHLAIAGVIIQLAALSILMTTSDLTYIYIYAILFGLSNGILITAMPTVIGEYCGRASFAPLMGIMLAVGIALESLAPVVAGIVYDSRATYIPAFYHRGGIQPGRTDKLQPFPEVGAAMVNLISSCRATGAFSIPVL